MFEFPEAGVLGSCELPNVWVLGNQCSSSVSKPFNHGAISPAMLPNTCFLSLSEDAHSTLKYLEVMERQHDLDPDRSKVSCLFRSWGLSSAREHLTTQIPSTGTKCVKVAET